MKSDKEEAVERLRQLINGNFENEIEVNIRYDYDSLLKTDKSLLTVNK